MNFSFSRLPRLSMVFILAFFIIASPSVAQSVTDASAVGFPMGGHTEGTGVESVQTNNGNLHVEIPLWSLPGRGVSTSASFVYNSQGWHLLSVNCNANGGDCSYIATPVVGSTMKMAVVLAGTALQGTGQTIGNTCGSYNHYAINGYLMREDDGTAHPLVPNPVVTNSSGGADTSCWRSNSGMLYAGDGSGFSNLASKTGGIAGAFDTNGNSVGTVDTLGRAVTTNGSYQDSQGVLRTPQVTTEAVTISTHICNGLANCTEATDTWTVPHIITLPDGLSYTIQYVQNDEGEISSITLPTGAVIAYTYEPSSTEPHGGKRIIKRQLTVGSQVSAWTYTYTAATQAGYPSTIQVTAPDLSYVQYSCTPNYGLDYAPYSQAPGSYQTIGCDISQTQSYSPSGSLIKTVTSSLSGWSGLPLAVTTTWAATNQAVSTQYDYETMNVTLFPDGTVGPKSGAITWGNVSEKREYDYGVGGPGALLRTTDYSYLHTDTTVNPNTNQAQYVALNIANRPTAEIVKDGSGNIVAQTKYYYDEGTLLSTSAAPAVAHDYTHFGASNTIRGNLTRVSRWNSTTNTWLDTSYTYDDLGNMRSVTDPKGNTTTYDYTDAFSGASCNTTTMATYAFRTTTTVASPFSFQTKNQYYGCPGLVESARDQNDINAVRPGTTYSYDLLNRLVGTTRADGGSTSISYGGTALNKYQDSLPLTETTTTTMNPSTNMVAATIMDGVGRPVQTQSSSSGGTIYVDTTYDLLGRVASVSNPYYSGSSSGITSYAYDSLGRKTMQCQPDNVNNSPCVAGTSYLQWSYSGNVTTSSDELKNSWQRTTDGLGRLTLVNEPGSLNTTYTYDALSNLQCVDQWGTAATGTACHSSKRRSFAYDSLSRLVTAYNPESGAVNYLYLSGTQKCSGDPSLPCSKTDARGITTTYTYDNLNRLTFKTYNDGTPLAAMGYDGNDEHGNALSTLGLTTSNPIGRLSIAWNEANAGEAFGYDSVGRTSLETYKTPNVSGWTNQVSALYDYAGHATTITYPDTRTISQGFDSGGRLNTVSYASWSGTTKNQAAYLTVPSTGYDAADHLTAGTLGNVVPVAATYDSRQRMQTLAYGPSSTPLWAKQYTWNAASDLILANDSVQGIARQYTYDNLNRITSAQDIGGSMSSTGQTTDSSGEYQDDTLSSAQYLGGTNWGVGNGTIAPNSAPAPDQSLTAVTLTANSGASNATTAAYSPTPSLYDGASISGSVWLKLPAGTGPLPVMLYVVDIGANYAAAHTLVNVSSTWQQFTIPTFTAQNGLVTLGLVVGGLKGTTPTITNGQTVYVWGPELTTSTAPDTNILPSSQQIAGAAWSIASGSITASTVLAPDGTNTGSTFTAGSVATVANGGASVADYVSNASQYSSTQVTASVYLKVATGTQSVNLYLGNNGSAGLTYIGGSPVVAPLTTTWQRFTVTGTTQAALTQLFLQIGGGGSVVASSQPIQIWGAQMVTGSSAGNYVPTSNTTTSPTGTTEYLAANGMNESYVYDAFGNIRQSGNFSFEQVYTASNQFSGWSYDASGNLLSDGVNGTYTYDANSMIATGNGATYVYNALGNRVGKTGTNAADTIYFGGRPIARFVGNAWTDLIYGTNGIIAEVPGTADALPSFYRMADHLGSSVGTLSTTGTLLSVEDYAPFGQVFTGTNPDPYKFTGKERDAESGLDYFGARYMSSNMGRWMSPDWSEQAEPVPYADLEFPQSLNLYSYVGNNPLASTDPDGHDFEYTSEQANLFKGGDASALSDGADSLLHPHLCTPCHANGEPYSRATEKEKADAAAAAAAAYLGWKLSIILAKSAFSITPRTIKVGPDEKAVGPHSVPKPKDAGGAKNGYTEFDENGNPVKRYRGEGKPHGGVKPPFVLEPKLGKGPGSKPIVPRPAIPEEIPQ